MELPEQADLVQKFMLAIAPEVVRFTTRHVSGSTWYSTDEAIEEQRRFLCATTARLTLEMAVHLAAQAASVNHAAKDAPAPKDPAQEPLEAATLQQRAQRQGTT